MSSGMDMSDMLGIFLEEADEQLQKLDDGILQLERNPEDIEVIKEIFRAAHTLKGSSATMGLMPIADLTHAMENLLDVLRNGTLTANPEIIDYLLAGIDALRTLVSQVSRGEQMNVDTEDLVANLKAACGSGSAEAKPKKTAKAKAAAKSAGSASAAGSTLNIKVKVNDDCLMPSVRAFMVFNAISGQGNIIVSDPPQEQIDDVQAGQVLDITLLPISGTEPVLKAVRALCEVELVKHSLSEPDMSKSVENTPIPSTSGGEGSESGTKSIQTVRVGVDRLDTLMNLVAELVIDRTRIAQIESELSLKYEAEELVANLAETAAHVGRVVTELQEHIMKVRLLPVEQVFNRFPRMVRDLAHKVGKEVDFVLQGQETELDRSILEDIVDPLTHLLRNALDHGIETPDERAAAGKPRRSRLLLAAKQEENRIVIEVADDGRGIPLDKVKASALKKGVVSEDALARMTEEDALQLIFASGLSTAEAITDISGRGVGMDVVRNNIQGLSGSVDVHTVPGQGTTFRISLPLTLAIIQALVTGVDDRVFVIPLSAVVETFRCGANELRYVDAHPAINFRGTVLPIVRLGEIFETQRGMAERKEAESITFVVVNTGVTKVGFVVDRLIGEQQVVIKPLGSFFGDISGVAGATILGDGRVAVIVDVAGFGALLNRRRYSRPSRTAVEV